MPTFTHLKISHFRKNFSNMRKLFRTFKKGLLTFLMFLDFRKSFYTYEKDFQKVKKYTFLLIDKNTLKLFMHNIIRTIYHCNRYLVSRVELLYHWCSCFLPPSASWNRKIRKDSPECCLHISQIRENNDIMGQGY